MAGLKMPWLLLKVKTHSVKILEIFRAAGLEPLEGVVGLQLSQGF